MENSSKALMIAAGILIAVLLLSLFAYLYFSMNNLSTTYNKNMSSQKIQAFNAQFTVYNDREDLTAQDIVSVANLAEEYNTKNELSSSDNEYITVKVFGTDNYTDINYLADGYTKFTFMEKYKNKTDKFRCSSIGFNNQSGKVNYMEFEKL